LRGSLAAERLFPDGRGASARASWAISREQAGSSKKERIMEETCRCQTEAHGHKRGECGKPATKPDGLCKECYDEAAAEQAEKAITPLSEPTRAAGLSEAIKSTTR
jgi:hypothetical protein